MSALERLRNWPWLTLQIIVANAAVIMALAAAWYLVFTQQSSIYSERLMSTFNIEPGRLHAMFVEDVERHLWTSVVLGLMVAVMASAGLALLIVRPLRSLAAATERLRHGDYQVRSAIKKGEVGRLADNFNALATTLEQEERRRVQYMADLSHELRTPITSLRGYTEGLEDRVFKADKSYFNLMASELNHLSKLIQTIESMQLDTVNSDGDPDISLDSLLHSIRDRWAARFRHQCLQFDLYASDKFDNRRLALPSSIVKQIVDNLLSNMIRYASPEGPCQINVSKGKKANFVQLRFSNLAPDISVDSLPFLFDRFFRVSESRTRANHEHSSGLGLAIVKQLCISNEGNVSAQLQDQRLTISVDLPLRKR